ncbi:hypothetical protein [Streptomyces liangshanensis]|uniref:hypothetical protein n=1 Tax=Streptomyces liangshanensis TaxID=2717324 RepID=UPI003C7EB327
MAGQRRIAGERQSGHPTRRGVLGTVLGISGVLLVPGCSGAPPAPDAATPAIQRALDGRAAGILGRDEDAYLAALDPAATRLRADARAEFAHLAGVPLSSWAYRVTGVERSGARATAQVELRYRLAGYDDAPVSTPREVSLTEHTGRWYVTGDRPAPDGGAQQLWQQGPVRVVRGAHCLVLGVGQTTTRLRAIAATADLAVPAVDDAWTGAWAHRVVLLVPRSLTAMAALLGAPEDGYRGIAAVTTGETGASGASPADRVTVNPAAYGALGDFGQRVVLTHETTHVATRTATSSATPTWLSEGFADWVAYRATGRTAAEIAPELQRAVRRGDLPAALPGNDAFSFSGDADTLARAYESGWLACELIAHHWGEKRLTAFYRAVGAGRQPDGAVEKAMNDVLSTTPDDFTARWRAYVRERLG